MDLSTRHALTQKLSHLSVAIAAALREPLLAEGPLRDRARALHAEENVGDAYELWTDLLARRAAVLWVLKSLYVRVLEDRDLLRPKRLLDPESEQLFAQLAPNLGPTDFLRWVFRDLAAAGGGLPELFAPQPAEIVPVPAALSRRLIDFWRSANPDTGELLYRFDGECFDSRLLGDLYQDLDPVVKKRYALLQTPDFVLDFILDQTLTPAIAELGSNVVRVLDPACGSGHFLLAAFRRLVAAERERLGPTSPLRPIVEGALARVVGIDLNDYACALARARLVMTALELLQQEDSTVDLATASAFHPRVYWADALEQVESAEQMGLEGIAPSHTELRSLLTPPEVRAALKKEIGPGFDVVVGNPPYITEKDKRRREYHSDRVGRSRRYLSAAQGYSLGAPFTERMLQLATPGGWVGEITADSFMKREFGKALIEEVLKKKDLVEVVSTSGAYIPGHGTPTALLFARNRFPESNAVRVVMGKRGEPGRPKNPAKGRVWRSIVDGHTTVGFENEFISVADVARTTMAQHPWSIGGGGAAELKLRIDEHRQSTIGLVAEHIGYCAILGEDAAFIYPVGHLAPRDVASRPMAIGEDVRDWSLRPSAELIFAFDEALSPCVSPESERRLWPLRTLLNQRIVSGSTTMRGAGRKWFDLRRLAREKLRVPLSIAFGEVSTHNHFVLDRGGKVFKQTAPVIKLPAGSTEEQHLVLLGQLNSSTACFWLKQVCQDKGIRGEAGGFTPDAWEHFYQFGGTKLESFPLATTDDARVIAFARRLDELARARLDDSAAAVTAAHAAAGADTLRKELDARAARDLERLFEMVGLQEELDWLAYRLYGLDPESDARPADGTPPLRPSERPFELTLAGEDAERRAAVARGEEPDELPTAWFERHGWEAVTEVERLAPDQQAVVAARLARTDASRELQLLEQPTFKRRWYRPDHAAEEKAALLAWLDDRVEAWARDRKAPFTAGQAEAALRNDPGLLAVGELLTGRGDFDVHALVADRLRAESVPNCKLDVFKPEGLLKRAQWERTWNDQREEDAGKGVVPAVPPKYDRADFLRGEHWSLRGKLDVPKERFIAFTEMPALAGAASEPRFGWAGWTPRERARALLALDEEAEGAGMAVAERHGLLHGVGFLLPYVTWESPEAARDFRADLKSLVGEQGVTEEMLLAWAATRQPSPKAPKAPKEPKPPKAAKPPKASKPAKAPKEPKLPGAPKPRARSKS